MPLSGSAFWGLVLPVEATNLITNSGFERGTQGWGTIQAGTIGTTSQYQQFGAWSGSVAPTSNGTAGAMSPTFTAGNGTLYTYSAYIKGQNGIPYRFGVGDSNGANLVDSITFTGAGTWHRYSGTWAEASGATRRLILKKDASADTGAIYIDGVNVTPGLLSTHIDGDQDGCYWLGEPHQSQSTRSGTYRGGGSVVALADLGLKPDEHLGIGMPPQEITALSYALLPGAEYQRSRAGERPFTLTFNPILGTNTQGFHVTRRTIINAIKPDLLDPQQPVRFWYTGGQGTVQIDAVYQSGLELGEMDGPMAENGAVTFVAHDPYWYSTTQEGTSLSARVALGSTNRIVRRDGKTGAWGTLGANGTTVDSDILCLTVGVNGNVFLGGAFGSVAGTAAVRLAQYNPQNNTFGTLAGGTLGLNSGNLTVQCMTSSPGGTLFFGGAFGTVGGGTIARALAFWTGIAFGTLTGGTITPVSASEGVNAVRWRAGTICFGGGFSLAGGTTARFLAMHRSGSFGTFYQNAGTVNGTVNALTIGLDGQIYFGGFFGSAGGTAAASVAVVTSTGIGTLGNGVQLTASTGTVYGMTTKLDGQIVVVGRFGTAGGAIANNSGQWNGVQWSALSRGIGTPPFFGYSVQTNPVNGDLLATGFFFDVGGVPLPDAMANYNGYAWLPLDIDLSANSIIFAAAVGLDQSIYIGGNFVGTANAAGITQVVNAGMGDAYPVVKLRNISASTIRLYQLGNTLTGDMLYFDLTFEPGEELTLVTEPGARSFTSDFAGNVFGRILPGSNITGFRLMPGTNYVSLFCDSGSVATSIYWQGRHDSADGGTIY